MPEKVSIREDLQVIQVESYGEVTSEDLKESLAAVSRIQQERGLTRLFVDATKETSVPGTSKIFDFGQKVGMELRGWRVAIAVSPATATDLSFFQNIALNRGAHVETFDSTDTALAWLVGSAE